MRIALIWNAPGIAVTQSTAPYIDCERTEIDRLQRRQGIRGDARGRNAKGFGFVFS